MVPSFCDTASWRFCPGVSDTSDITSIDRLAIAIRTRLSAITLTTLASTTLPAWSTGVAASATGLAALTGTIELIGVGISGAQGTLVPP
ncbi:hypothetical protein BJ6T_44240 [Bradyrhizobium japonicum USDA 6]|nr:hypothetical protein BJ6T_44240 [Bradyrhizobium japonicum USDA 6]